MPNDLIARIEAAGEGEQRALLVEAWEAVNGDLWLADGTWREGWVPFLAMLDASAFVDAAMMLMKSRPDTIPSDPMKILILALRQNEEMADGTD